MSASPGSPVAPVEADPGQRQAARARPGAAQRLRLDRYAILIVFAGLVVGFGIARPSTFLSIGDLSNILGSQAVLFILVMAVLLHTRVPTGPSTPLRAAN
jgi:ribose transport system permease protein